MSILSFAYPYELPLALLGLWAGLLFGGFALGRPAPGTMRRMPTWTRIGSSLALVAAAWTWYAVAPSGDLRTYARMVALGMTLGTLGDLFMAGLLPVGIPALGGMGAFALGHLAYIAAGLSLGTRLGLAAAFPRYGAWSLWLLVGLAGWYWVIYRGRQPTLLHRVALPYALLLASTAGVAAGLALQSAAFVPLALGTVLFLVSDLILAARLFNGARTRGVDIDDIVWLTYGPGQMLIVYAVWLLL